MRPFAHGTTIVVGYYGNYRQPWVWVEGEDVYPTQLLPRSAMWSQFGYWSELFDSTNDMGLCIHRDGVFQRRDEVGVSECDQAAEDLAHAIEDYWGNCAKVIWQKLGT